MCPDCRREAVERNRRNRQKRLQAGMCYYCGKRLKARGHQACQPCLDEKAMKKRIRKKMGSLPPVGSNPTIVESPINVWLPPDDKGSISE